MNRLLYRGISEADAAAIYEAWLLGVRPAVGAAITCGPALLLTDRLPDLSAVPVEGEPAVRTALADPLRTAGALRNFRDWRRLPVGTAAGVSSAGLLLFPAEQFSLPDDAAELTFPGVLDTVGTEKEIGDALGRTAKAVRTDCEAGLFGRRAKRTPTGWLISRAAWEEKETQADLLPLLLVFATAEAAALWNRPAEDVRSAAAGAGHRAARLEDGERRRAGRTWLVTRAAMEKLYGDPAPEKWRAFIKERQAARPSPEHP